MCVNEIPELDNHGNIIGVKKVSENGYSNENLVTEWILRERDRLEKADDKSLFYNFVKQYPLTIDEVFEVNRNGVFPKDVYDKLHLSEKKIIEGDRPVQCDLYRDADGSVKTKQNKNGSFYIYEHPKSTEEYIAGQDPIPFGENNIGDGSDHVCAIKNRLSNVYVAMYAKRSLDSEVVIDDIIMLQEYYRSNRYPKGALCNMETNTGGVALKVYRDRGKYDLLSDRPINLGIEYEDKKVKKGWYNNNKTLPRGINYLTQYLIKYSSTIRFKRMIDELRRFPDGNNDVVMSMIGCEILDAELVEMDKKRYKIGVRYKHISYLTMNPDGTTVRKWEKVIV
jgi:hypothetical protein